MNISSLNNPYVKTAFAVVLGYSMAELAKKVCHYWNNRHPQKPQEGFNLKAGDTPAKVDDRNALLIDKPVTKNQRYASIAFGIFVSAVALYVSGVADAGFAYLAGRVSAPAPSAPAPRVPAQRVK